MHLGYSTLGFHPQLVQRRWNWADNKHVEMVFETGHIPAFHLILDTLATVAEVKVFNAFTDEGVEPSFPITVEASGDKMYFRFAGADVAGLLEGYYYLGILIDEEDDYWSDVFGWKDDPSDMLKVEATGDDILLGAEHLLDMEDFTFKGYFYSEIGETEADINEEGVEKPYGNKPIYNTRNIVNSFEITGNRAIYKFLSGLRVLEVNGDVTFTYNGIEMSAYDINVEKKESNAFDETIILTLKFKEQDYLSAINAI